MLLLKPEFSDICRDFSHFLAAKNLLLQTHSSAGPHRLPPNFHPLPMALTHGSPRFPGRPLVFLGTRACLSHE